MNSIFDFFEEFYSKEQAAILIQNILDFDSSDVVIKDLLQMLGQKTKSERSYILEYEKGKIYKNTYEWCAEGIESRQDRSMQVRFRLFNGERRLSTTEI